MAAADPPAAIHIGGGVYITAFHRPDKYFKLTPTIKIQQLDLATRKMNKANIYNDFRKFLFNMLPAAQIVVFDKSLDRSRDLWTFPTIDETVDLVIKYFVDDVGRDTYKLYYATPDKVRPAFHEQSLTVYLSTAGLHSLVDTFNTVMDLPCGRCNDDFHRIPCYLDYRPVNLPCTIESVKTLYDFIDDMNGMFRERGFTLNPVLMRLVAPNELQNIFAGIPCPKKSRNDERSVGKPGGGPRSPLARKRSYLEMSGTSGSGASKFKRNSAYKNKHPGTVKVELIPGSPPAINKYIKKSKGLSLINSQYSDSKISDSPTSPSVPDWEMDYDQNDSNDELFNVSPYSPSLLSSPGSPQKYNVRGHGQEFSISPIFPPSGSIWERDNKIAAKYRSRKSSTPKETSPFKLADPPVRNRLGQGNIKQENQGESVNEIQGSIKREKDHDDDYDQSEGQPSKNDNAGSMPKNRRLF